MAFFLFLRFRWAVCCFRFRLFFVFVGPSFYSLLCERGAEGVREERTGEDTENGVL